MAGKGKGAKQENVQNVQSGAREPKVSEETLMAAAKKSSGIMSYLAKFAGIDRRTAKKYVEMYPEVKAEFESQQEGMLDFCEGELLRIIQGTPDPVTKIMIEHPRKFDALQFALSTLGKKRGYTTKVEQEVSGGLKGEPPKLSIVIEK